MEFNRNFVLFISDDFTICFPIRQHSTDDRRFVGFRFEFAALFLI
jgi:hypothetical protein